MVTKKLNALGAFEDLELFNKEGNKVYEFITSSDVNGYWAKYTYDSDGKKLTLESSDGYWDKSTYNSNGNLLTYEDSDGYWSNFTYDSNGNVLTFENSDGEKRGFDIHIPEYTMEELVIKLGHDFKIMK
jgi:YD repeat-containing protein